MLQIVEVEQKGLNDAIRDAFCLAAAERFLDEDARVAFVAKLGQLSEDSHILATAVTFSDPLTTPAHVVELSREMGGVVVVPVGQKDEQNMQLFYGAWLSN